MLAGFASIALLLASVGLYGVLAFQVSRRVHEIGVRIALGASTTSVSRDVLQKGLVLVATGATIGLPAAFLLSRFVQGMLFGVGEADLLTYAGVATFLLTIATLACLLPARRAAHVDPVRAFQEG